MQANTRVMGAFLTYMAQHWRNRWWLLLSGEFSSANSFVTDEDLHSRSVLPLFIVATWMLSTTQVSMSMFAQIAQKLSCDVSMYTMALASSVVQAFASVKALFKLESVGALQTYASLLVADCALGACHCQIWSAASAYPFCFPSEECSALQWWHIASEEVRRKQAHSFIKLYQLHQRVQCEAAQYGGPGCHGWSHERRSPSYNNPCEDVDTCNREN